MKLQPDERDFLRLKHNDYKKVLELDKFLQDFYQAKKEVKKFEKKQKEMKNKIFKEDFKKLN